ncbi:hypothetical protein WG66_002961, partial [Moniliophthora roreri]
MTSEWKPFIRGMPKAILLELDAIWEADKRTPTLQSRRNWANARKINPQLVNRWYWKKKSYAKRQGVQLPSDTEMYELDVGIPPEIQLEEPPVVKTELKLELEDLIVVPSLTSALRNTRVSPTLRRSRRLAGLLDNGCQSSSSDIDAFFHFSSMSSPTSSLTTVYSSPSPSGSCTSIQGARAYTPFSTSKDSISGFTTPLPQPEIEMLEPQHCGLSLPDDDTKAEMTCQEEPNLICSENNGAGEEASWICDLCKVEESESGRPSLQPSPDGLPDPVPPSSSPSFPFQNLSSIRLESSGDPVSWVQAPSLDIAFESSPLWELSAIPFESRSRDYILPHSCSASSQNMHPYTACSARIESLEYTHSTSFNFVFCGYEFSPDGFYICPHQQDTTCDTSPCTCYDALYNIPLQSFSALNDPDLQELLPPKGNPLTTQIDVMIRMEPSGSMELP